MSEPERLPPPPADPARLLDASREPILLVTPDGHVAYANTAARTRLGLAPGGPLAARLDPPSQADLDDLIAAYPRDGAFPEDDRAWTWTLPDGRPEPTRVSVANLWDEGRVAGFVATVRRDGEGAADRRRAEELARAVVRHAPVGIQVFDAAGNEVRRNQAMRRMLARSAGGGAERYNMLKDPAAQAGGDADRFRRALAGEVVNDRGPAGPEPAPGDSAVGVRPVVDRVFHPIPDGRGGVQGVVVFSTDVSVRRQMDEKLLEAQRLEGLGVLAGGLAHDLNNLMTPIVGHAELALGAVPAEVRGPVADHLRKVTRSAEQAADLCRQLLAYTGRGRFAVGPADLSALIRGGESLLRHAAGPHVDLRLDLVPKLPAVRADAGQLRQVVLNLVANAAEAIGDRPGRVEVSTRLRRLGRAELAGCRVGADRPAGEYVRLAVRDTGPGMPPDVAARAFDPFFTTKFTGRGLGLAAVLGVVQGHGGALSVETAPGRGTTFRLYLPAVTEPAPVRPETDAHAPLPSWGGEVLLADDEEDVRAAVGAMLEGLGFRVDAVADGRDAVERARAGKQYRLAILDLTMREVGGAEALRELKRLAPALPVVLMSGYNLDEVEGVGGPAGPAGVLRKPFRLSDLAEQVRDAVAAG